MLPNSLQTGNGLPQESRRVLKIRVPKRQLTAHPKMHHESIPIEVKQEELTPAGQKIHSLAGQPGSQFRDTGLEDSSPGPNQV
jgi:hypothetical protein